MSRVRRPARQTTVEYIKELERRLRDLESNRAKIACKVEKYSVNASTGVVTLKTSPIPNAAFVFWNGFALTEGADYTLDYDSKKLALSDSIVSAGLGTLVVRYFYPISHSVTTLTPVNPSPVPPVL